MGDRFPLSSAQHRVWFLEQLTPGLSAYVISASLLIEGRLDPRGVAWALDRIARRHEPLRTTFHRGTDGPCQFVHAAHRVRLLVVDLDGRGPGDAASDAAFVEHLARRPFDLESPPLMRAVLTRRGGQAHALVFVAHHLIADEWSLEIVLKDFLAYYAAWCERRACTLPGPEIHYADFAVWQQAWMAGAERAQQIAWWRRQLAHVSRLPLPVTGTRPATLTDDASEGTFTVPASILAPLTAIGRTEGGTLFMTLLAAFMTVLHRETGATDIAVGTAMANRVLPETHGTVGFFANTTVIRADFTGPLTFRDVLTRVRVSLLGAMSHQQVPFDAVVEALNPPRALNRMPFYDAWFAMSHVRGPLEVPGGRLSRIRPREPSVRCDWRCGIWVDADAALVALEHSRRLFERSAIETFLHAYDMFIRRLIEVPDEPVSLPPATAPDPNDSASADWRLRPMRRRARTVPQGAAGAGLGNGEV